MDNGYMYVCSFYFVVTTLVTVGYGDITAYSTNERIVCIFLMMLGVVSFSFATGAVASLISSHDSDQAQLKEKITTLNEI